MQYDDALRLLPVESADNGEFTFNCPSCFGTATCYRGLDDEAVLSCLGGCKEEEILGDSERGGRESAQGRALEGQESPNGIADNARQVGSSPTPPTNVEIGGNASEEPALEASPNGADAAKHKMDGNGVGPDLSQWKLQLYEMTRQTMDGLIKTRPDNKDFIAAMETEAFAESVNKVRNVSDIWLTHDPQGLSQTEIDEEVWTIAQAVQKVYAPALVNGNGKVEHKSALIRENQGIAMQANAEYLARPEIIEKLGYSQSIALMIGAKHHGKTTNVRTLALSVMRGLPIWGRATSQGFVVYAASDDEVASTRNELLRMGWNEQSDPLELVHIDPQSNAEPQEILNEIGDVAISNRANLIILDMLFDFVGIRNELSYSETREALGMVQTLADKTKCLVVGSHHTPKYLNEGHSAANAALGSQGVSARFSPIILTRKWTDTLFTVESTTVRDPRGQELKPLKIVKNEMGWIETAGEFKEWMKWEIYAQRVLDLFDSPQRGLTVYSIAEKSGIERARVQNTVKELTDAGKLKREKSGRAFMYYLGSSNMFERQGGQWKSDEEKF